MLAFFLTILTILVAAVVVDILYFFFYTFRINKQLKNPHASGNAMLSPALFSGMSIIGVLFAIFLAIILVYPWKDFTIPPISNQYHEQYDLSIHTPQEMEDGYLGRFSPESNEGYEKHEETVDDIKFTYFTSQDSYDTFHPNFIVYIEYVGSEDVLTYGLNTGFHTHEDDPFSDVPRFKGLAGMDVLEARAEEYLCIIGNTPVRCNFSVSIYYHDTEEVPYDPDMPDVVGKSAINAVADGSLSIQID